PAACSRPRARGRTARAWRPCRRRRRRRARGWLPGSRAWVSEAYRNLDTTVSTCAQLASAAGMRRVGPVAAVIALLAAGCGGDSHRQTSTSSGGQLAPGKVPRAAKSNAHKEIPTRFNRAISLPYRSTTLLVTPVRVARVGRGATGVVVGIRNIGPVE